MACERWRQSCRLSWQTSKICLVSCFWNSSLLTIGESSCFLVQWYPFFRWFAILMCTCINGYRFFVVLATNSAATGPRSWELQCCCTRAGGDVVMGLSSLRWLNQNLFSCPTCSTSWDFITCTLTLLFNSYVWHQDQVPVTLAWMSHRLRLPQSEVWKLRNETNNFQFWRCWGFQRAMNSKAPPKQQRCGREPRADLDQISILILGLWLPQVGISYDGYARLTSTASSFLSAQRWLVIRVTARYEIWWNLARKSSCNQHLQINSNNRIRVQSTSKY